MSTATAWLDSLLNMPTPDVDAITGVLSTMDGYTDERTGRTVFACVRVPGATRALRSAAIRAAGGAKYPTPAGSSNRERFYADDLRLRLLCEDAQEGVSSDEALEWVRGLGGTSLHSLRSRISQELRTDTERTTAAMAWIPLDVRALLTGWFGMMLRDPAETTGILRGAEEVRFATGALLAWTAPVEADRFAEVVGYADALSITSHGGAERGTLTDSEVLAAGAVRSLAALLNHPDGEFSADELEAIPICVLARQSGGPVPLLASHIANQVGPSAAAWQLTVELSEQHPEQTTGQVIAAVIGATRPLRNTRTRKAPARSADGGHGH